MTYIQAAKRLFVSVALFFSFSIISSEKNDKGVVDFSSIKDLLKRDKLDEEARKILAKKEKSNARKQRLKVAKYDIPSEKKIWTFISELWLVKNATTLKWDFRGADYGLEKSFRNFLEGQGVYELQFKILLLDSPMIFHMALPSDNGSVIFLLSLPFIRQLDLSKLEISILLYEDYQRHKMDYFKNKVKGKKLAKVLGKNFYNKKIDQKIFEKILKKYSDVALKEGFTFQEQFAVTKQMNTLLKSNLRFWGIYYKMIQKIDDMTKSNLIYKNYAKIFPSPELQLNWLNPKK